MGPRFTGDVEVYGPRDDYMGVHVGLQMSSCYGLPGSSYGPKGRKIVCVTGCGTPYSPRHLVPSMGTLFPLVFTYKGLRTIDGWTLSMVFVVELTGVVSSTTRVRDSCPRR